MVKILLVEDDRLLSDGLAFALEKDGHSVCQAYSFSEGYARYEQNKPEMILLDIGLPDKSGLQLCLQIRKICKIPIIYLTANDTDQDIIRGFQTGCDDYIAKPFSIEVLKHRIHAVLRRTSYGDSDIFQCGELIVNYRLMSLFKNEEEVKLTATEYRLVEILTRNKGQVLTREVLLQKLWDDSSNFVDENALSVNISRVRQKIEYDSKNPQYVKTVFGIGYTWGVCL